MLSGAPLRSAPVDSLPSTFGDESSTSELRAAAAARTRHKAQAGHNHHHQNKIKAERANRALTTSVAASNDEAARLLATDYFPYLPRHLKLKATSTLSPKKPLFRLFTISCRQLTQSLGDWRLNMVAGELNDGRAGSRITRNESKQNRSDVG